MTFDKLEEDWINSTLAKFKDPTGNPKTAWKITKELTGKKKLLSTSKEMIEWQVGRTTSKNFSEEEVVIALTAVKPGKAPGLDGLTFDLWKLPKVCEVLRSFCIRSQGTGRVTRRPEYIILLSFSNLEYHFLF